MSLPMAPDKKPWYQKGLRFACTGCGKCCTGFPGHVWVSEEERQAIASYLECSLKVFTEKFLIKVGSRYSLKEKGEHFDCVFLEGKACTIYPHRPKQCRTYPFWPEVLKNKESWDEEKKLCEGLRDDAPLVSLEEIRHAQEN